MNALESLGQKQLELEKMNKEYNNLLALLNSVCAGEIQREDVIVDLESRSWHLIDKELSIEPPAIEPPVLEEEGTQEQPAE